MLPKPEKNKKSSSAQQLDLVESISSEDKVKKKRTIILLFLSFFVGLSLIFSFYRLVRQKIAQKSSLLPAIDLPSLSLSPSAPAQALEIIAADPASWSIYLQSPGFTWSYPDDNLPDPEILSGIDQQLASASTSSAPLSQLLPQGALIKQVDSNQPDYYQTAVRIIVPQNQITLIIRVSNSPNPDASRQLIPSLVQKLYWYAVSQP
jgi:hypothetical protein